MAEFKYKAFDANGRKKLGTVSSGSRDMARSQLARMRLKVVSIEEVNANAQEEGLVLLGGRLRLDKKGNIYIGGPPGVVSDRDLIIFTKQLQTMITSGVPLNQALFILSKQQKNKGFGEIIAKLQSSLESGLKFSAALEAHPRTFDTLYVSMVRAGEESGKIAEILLTLVSYVEKASRIKRQIRSAMIYPALIIFVAFAVVAFLLTIVVPKFVAQFRDSGTELPGLTMMVITLSDYLVANWAYIIAGIVASVVAFRVWYKTKDGERLVHAFLLKAPVVGDLVRKIAVGRFCSTMSSMLSSGVNIIQALNICGASAGNVVIEKFVYEARSKVEQGQLLSLPLSTNPIFPQMVISMIEIGEKSGRLDEMLTKVSEFYEEEVDEAVKAMLAMIEPILIVVIGAIVGVLVVAMYLPILDLGNTVAK